MKRFMLIFCSLLITLGATAQSKLGSQTTKIAKDSTLIKIHDLLEDVDFRIHGLDRYKSSIYFTTVHEIPLTFQKVTN